MNRRNPSFELLRIIAMLMIVTLHYNMHSDSLLQLGVPASGVQVFATIIELFCITGVNVYVLISGYFLSQTTVKISRMLTLIMQVYFYTLLISLAMILGGTYTVHTEDGIYKTAQYLFPVSSEHYWFVTAYVIMYVLAPVMNAAVEKLTRKQLKMVIIGLLIWFSVIKSIVPVMFATDNWGYDFGWFICLYLIAAYIRKYNVVLFYSARRSALVFLVSTVISILMTFVLHFINLNYGGLIYYSQVPMHYNFILTLISSLGIFSFFRFYKMKENKTADIVRFIAPFTFGVYLLHMHIEIRDRWVEWLENIFGPVPTYSIPLYLWHLIRCVILVFAAGIFVDWIRKMIFDYVGRVLHDTRLFAKIRQWDDELC